MPRSTERSVSRAVAAAVGFAALLAGCSDIYFDRRETVLFGADDAVASNNAVQTIDPWPPASADRHIPGNGAKVETAIQRYRTGRVIQPQGTGTASSYQQQAAQQQAPAQQTQPTSPGTGSPNGGIPVP